MLDGRISAPGGFPDWLGSLFCCSCHLCVPVPQCPQQVPGFLWHAWQLVLTKTTVSKYGTLWSLDFWHQTTDSIPLLFVAWILLSAPIWELQFSLLFEPCLVLSYFTSLLAFFLQHQPYSRPKWAYRYNTGELFLKANFSLIRLISLGAPYSPWRETYTLPREPSGEWVTGLIVTMLVQCKSLSCPFWMLLWNALSHPSQK